jgi:hypothetical protein
MSSLSTIYTAYETLNDKEKAGVSKDQQLERGYVDIPPLLPGRPPVSLRTGPKKSVENSNGSVHYFFQLAPVGTKWVHLLLKLEEARALFEELQWGTEFAANDQARRDLQKEKRILQAELANKMTAEGKQVNPKHHQDKIKSTTGRIRSKVTAIHDSAHKAAITVASMLGPYGAIFTKIVDSYHATSLSFVKTEHTVVSLPCMKDPTDTANLIYPLEIYDQDDSLFDPAVDETTEYKFQSVAKESVSVVTEVPKKTLKTIQECMFKLLIKQAGYGLAEAQRDYLKQNMKYPTSFALSVREFADQIKAINSFLPKMTSFKDDPTHANDADIVRANVELNNVDLCKVLLNSMPNKLREKYKVLNPHATVVKDYDSLVEQLDAIVVSLKSERNAAQKNPGSGKNGNSNGNPNGNANSSNRNGNNNPRNNQRNKNGNNVMDSLSPYGNTNQPVGGGCANCQKHKPDSNAWKTHSKSQCRIYNVDGTRKPSNRQLRDHSKNDDDDMDDYEAFQKFKKMKRESYTHSRRSRSRSRSRSHSRSRSPERSSRHRSSRRY